MDRPEVVRLIIRIAKQKNAFDVLASELGELDREALSNALLHCGTIPEVFSADSSEEKLWAKYCDILLSQAFNHLGIVSDVLRTRGDSADVFGRAQTYTIVADAKAFRLSRTAKNQKDFKIDALNDWRKEDTYACLVAPLLHYPSQTSQIYRKAIERNVILIAYEHLWFLLRTRFDASLEALWQCTPSVQIGTPSSRMYWTLIDDSLLNITSMDVHILVEAKRVFANHLIVLGAEGVDYWNAVIERYQQFTKEEAIKRLVATEKIPQKIATINQMLNRARIVYE